MEKDKQSFLYTYSASEKEEIERIRKKYLIAENDEAENKIDLLKAMDKKVTSKATVAALICGVLSTLCMGAGMSFIMTDIGAQLSLKSSILIGLFMGILGVAGIISAYPLYSIILKRERRRIAPQMIKLTNELSGE